MAISPEKPDCVVCTIRASGLFGALEDRRHLDRVNREKTAHRYAPRQVIFHEGTPPLAIYCVRSGRVKLYRSSREGEEMVIRILGPGQPFGYRPLLAGELYSASAAAIEEAEICMLPKQTLLELLRDSHSLAFELLVRLSRELRLSEDLLLNVSQRSARQRVAHLLLMFGDGSGQPVEGGIRLSVPIQRREMAQMIGTTPETFSRILRDFADAALISLSRSEIVILDGKGLRMISGD